MTRYVDSLESPLGLLRIEADETHVLAVLYDRAEGLAGQPNDVTHKCKSQLSEYFKGERTVFDVSFKLQGTAFQDSVWTALLEIPFGKTATYGEQAMRLQKPKAVRAVGAANGRNKINIIVPCHRVIGSSGSLIGYGGGLERKRWLLDHENSVAKASSDRHSNDA
ncbi:MAG: methylated-DNA--[protein]-cysteine S-methyltransferase [Pseudomonadota bacterium]